MSKRSFEIASLLRPLQPVAIELLLLLVFVSTAIADQTPLVVSSTSLKPALESALAPKESEEKKPAVEVELGHLSLEGVNGQDFSATDHKKKRVALYFWSVYCRGCVGAIDQLESMREDLAKNNTELYTVHLFEPRKDKLTSLLTKLGVSLPIVMAPKQVRDLFSIRILPTTLVFDEDHRLVTRIEGEVDEEGLRLRLFRKVEEVEDEAEAE